MLLRSTTTFACLLLLCGSRSEGETSFETGQFKWRTSKLLIDTGPGRLDSDQQVSIKDPSIVYAAGRWHLFATARMKSGNVDITYLNFKDWSLANDAPRRLLKLHDQYYCAPQVFFYKPHKQWYLIFQLADKAQTP